MSIESKAESLDELFEVWMKTDPCQLCFKSKSYKHQYCQNCKNNYKNKPRKKFVPLEEVKKSLDVAGKANLELTMKLANRNQAMEDANKIIDDQIDLNIVGGTLAFRNEQISRLKAILSQDHDKEA
jgi:hypothetical protein